MEIKSFNKNGIQVPNIIFLHFNSEIEAGSFLSFCQILGHNPQYEDITKPFNNSHSLVQNLLSVPIWDTKENLELCKLFMELQK